MIKTKTANAIPNVICARRCEVGGRKWLCFSPHEENHGNDCVDVPGQSEVEWLLLGRSGGESDGPVWSEMTCLVNLQEMVEHAMHFVM